MSPCRCRLIMLILLPALVMVPAAVSQTPPRANGIHESELRLHAVTGARIIIRPGVEIETGILLIRNGIIEAVGEDIEIPAAARTWPADGKTIYPGLVEPACLLDVEADLSGPGTHWNRRIRSQVDLSRDPLLEVLSGDVRARFRDAGYTVAAVYPRQGMFRGTGAVVPLDDRTGVVQPYGGSAPMAGGFDYRGGGYPSSLMGAIALSRQVLMDARWYREAIETWEAHPQQEAPERNDALAALGGVIDGTQAILWETRNELDALRAARIADEFSLDMIILGSGSEYRHLGEIGAVGRAIVLPLDFPDAPDLHSPSAMRRVDLRTMMAWEQAPANAARLHEAGCDIVLTTHGLNRPSDLRPALRRAMPHGLDSDTALAALTTGPAGMLGVDHLMGTLEKGKAANFIICDGDFFEKGTKILDTWINGRRFEITAPPHLEISRSGFLEHAAGPPLPVRFETKGPSIVLTLPGDEKVKGKKVTVSGDRFTAVIDGRIFGITAYVTLAGVMTPDSLRGSFFLPGGERIAFHALLTEEIDPEENGEVDDEEDAPADDPLSGEWSGTLDMEFGAESVSVDLVVQLVLEDDGLLSGELSVMDQEESITLEQGFYDATRRTVSFRVESEIGLVRIEGVLDEDRIEAVMNSPMGENAVVFHRQGEGDPPAPLDDEEGEETETPIGDLVFPLGAYGRTAVPGVEDLLLVNGTIWTCGKESPEVLDPGWMLVRGGRVEAVGSMPAPDVPGVRKRDLEGRHVTPGLIDCHSHTGISNGVNEGTRASSAEVSIQSVVNPDDINWYRQLAGGLTAANQLHGSANPIGGQNSVVKLKWGHSSEDMKVADATPGIKFALGENVKRSTSRYPNTRMGVETYIRDRFAAAHHYRESHAAFQSLAAEEQAERIPPRRDLELDTLVEILEGERMIHCHSYRQDEILMLLRLAEEKGFRIGTLQHILEGYKVAGLIADHGAGASSFSDWWAYKVEVMDAIPHNGAIMHDVGVLVSFNSDSSELARRMNTEASKAVRYGGVSPAEALQFVTLNPAIQLGIGHRTGSLEAGKDADFVIWSGNPLSTYSRCEQTWIEGARYFDLDDNEELLVWSRSERQRLVGKILAKSLGNPPAPPEDGETGEDEHQHDHRTIDRRGICGCDELDSWEGEGR